MKKFSEQFINKANTISLTPKERELLRARVRAYQEYHPLATTMTRTLSARERELLQEPFREFRFSWWTGIQVAGVACVCLVVGVTWRAEYAIPGDALYAMKVGFNEEVRSTLAFSAYDKITWETERLNRRLAEARVLAEEGRLTNEVGVAVAKAVRTHSENARREIAELQTSDRDEATLAAVHLASTLDVQAAALQGSTPVGDVAIQALTTTEGEPPVADTDAVTALIAEAVVAERAITAVPTDSELPSYERMLAHAETDTTRARELLSSVRENATPEEVSDIERRLADTDRVLAEALSLGQGDVQRAQSLLLDVIQRTQKIIVFMTNIDVRTAVALEAIVPIERTDEERVIAVSDALAQARAAIRVLEEALPTLTMTPEVAERVATAQILVVERIEGAEKALASNDLVTAETASAEALAFAEDTLALVGLSPDSVSLLLEEPVVSDEGVATSSPVVPDVNEGSGAATSSVATTTAETSTSTTEG
jgi:hypothetical protein